MQKANSPQAKTGSSAPLPWGQISLLNGPASSPCTSTTSPQQDIRSAKPNGFVEIASVEASSFDH
jgi:hypothetical protein